MIITEKKPFSELLEDLKEHKKLFLVGCSLCATTCKTGGEKDLEKIEEAFIAAGKTVTGRAVPDPTCSILEVKRLYRKYAKEIDAADAIVSFSCGGGTQAIADTLKNVKVYPGSNTLFQGEITKNTIKEREFEQKCSLCGECILADTGGLCPVTRCPKGLVNGPCGGVSDGKCEVDKNIDCVWIKIYERLKESGKLDSFKKIQDPKDHSKSKKPQRLNIK